MSIRTAPRIGLPADELVPYTATTTYVSAGDAGANNFSAFRTPSSRASRSRIFAFVHISTIGLAGFPVGEMLNIDYADVDAAAKTRRGESATSCSASRCARRRTWSATTGSNRCKRAIARRRARRHRARA